MAQPLPTPAPLAAPSRRRAASQRPYRAVPALFVPPTEDALGVSEWLDPETGEPAEGRSPPHLYDE